MTRPSPTPRPDSKLDFEETPQACPRASGIEALAALRPQRPRLLVGPETWERLRARARAGTRFRAVVHAALERARARLQAPPPARELEGIRLLAVSRRVLADAVWLSVAYRLTDDPKFLAAAERNLLAAASFIDWNPSHFLDVAEMTAALAIGYDWLHSDLSSESRKVLRSAIAEKGIRPAFDPDAAFNWWHARHNNWNQVCLGGLVLGALAIGDEEPELAARALDLLRARGRHGLAPYSPAGIYPEGPNYWRYGTLYSVMTFAALRSALGSDDFFPPDEAFLAGARVQSLLVAPSGQAFTFADSGRFLKSDPLLFWFAERLCDPSLLAGQGRFYGSLAAAESPDAILPEELFALLHWQEPPAAPARGWTAWMGEGAVPLAVFWGPETPRGAFYLATKGGSPTDNHAHMDGGGFVLEIDGVRWAHDLGMQEYHLLEQSGIKLFDGRPGGDRWRVFRYTNHAHNTLTIDDSLHDAAGRVRLRDFCAREGALGVSVDLAPALAPLVSRAARRFEPHADGLGLMVVDELAGLRPGSLVRWTLVTRAAVTLEGRTALLREAGRELQISARSPDAVAISTASAAGPEPFDEAAEGFSRVLLETTAPKDGNLRLSVELRAR